MNVKTNHHGESSNGRVRRKPFSDNALASGDSKPRILAIDDDRTVLRLIETAFENSDVDLTTV